METPMKDFLRRGRRTEKASLFIVKPGTGMRGSLGRTNVQVLERCNMPTETGTRGNGLGTSSMEEESSNQIKFKIYSRTDE
jgi:hypothetical protein